MPQIATSQKSKINCKQIDRVSIEELLAYHQPGDPRLPIKQDGSGQIDYCKIPGGLLLKLAARYGEDKRIIAVQYQHCGASKTKNHYTSVMIVVDSSRFDVPTKLIQVGKKSIGVNGFVALTPPGREQLVQR